MIQDYMTGKEARDYLEVSKQRLQELADAGRIRRHRMGRFWLYLRADVETYKAAPRDKGGRPKKIAGPLMIASPA